MMNNMNLMAIAYTVIGVVALLKGPDALIRYRKKTEADTISSTKKYLITGLTAAVLIADLLTLGCLGLSTFNLLALSIISIMSGVIVIVDTRVKIIPNVILFPMLGIALAYIIVNMNNFEQILISIATMMSILYGLLFAAKLLHMESCLGAGDIKYLSVAGLLFGVGRGMTGMVIGICVTLALYLIPMMIAKKVTLKSMIAFGPFIGYGVMVGLVTMVVPL